jgi:hypothetical protein
MGREHAPPFGCHRLVARERSLCVTDDLVDTAIEAPLMGISARRATAAAIPGARMLEIDGMGHDLPRFAWLQIVENITAVANRSEHEHPVSTQRDSND